MALKTLEPTIRHRDTPKTGQQLDEVAGLLAAGILRLHLRNPPGGGEAEKTAQKSLDACARQSVHASRT